MERNTLTEVMKVRIIELHAVHGNHCSLVYMKVQLKHFINSIYNYLRNADPIQNYTRTGAERFWHNHKYARHSFRYPQ